MCFSTSGNKFVYLCAATACLSSILLGYDIGVMSGAIVYMERDIALTTVEEEVIVSFLSFFSIPGALIGGQLAATYGRKKTIALSACLFFVGTIIMIITKIFWIILIGRILLGIATGLGLLIAPLYTAEIAPPAMRGKLVALSEISINTGILFGYFIAWLFYFMHDDEAWRVMISFGCIPSILLFLGMCIMPESPRWLIEQNQISEAKEVLHKITTFEETTRSSRKLHFLYLFVSLLCFTVSQKLHHCYINMTAMQIFHSGEMQQYNTKSVKYKERLHWNQAKEIQVGDNCFCLVYSSHHC